MLRLSDIPSQSFHKTLVSVICLSENKSSAVASPDDFFLKRMVSRVQSTNHPLAWRVNVGALSFDLKVILRPFKCVMVCPLILFVYEPIADGEFITGAFRRGAML